MHYAPIKYIMHFKNIKYIACRSGQVALTAGPQVKIHDQLDASWVAFCRISVAYLNFFWISWDIQNILINLIARYFYAKYQWHIWTLFWKLLGYGKHPEQSDASSPGRYVLKIHFFIELGLKMIQFKTKSRIFIQKDIHSIESSIFNRIMH